MNDTLLLFSECVEDVFRRRVANLVVTFTISLVIVVIRFSGGLVLVLDSLLEERLGLRQVGLFLEAVAHQQRKRGGREQHAVIDLGAANPVEFARIEIRATSSERRYWPVGAVGLGTVMFTLGWLEPM